MAFIIDRADAVASMLENFTTAHAYQVAGQFANRKFWIDETLHALEALAEYGHRFDRLVEAQEKWIAAHNVVVGTFCPMCEGQCEFEPGLKPPAAPIRIPAKGRDAAIRRLKDAFYYFTLRCFRMKLIDERGVRELCSRVETGVEPRDLVRN